MLCFREFRKEDEKAVVSIVMELEKFYPSIDKWVNKQIKKIIQKEVECLIVEVDGEIAGCAISGIEEKGINTVKLKTFYITEKYWGCSFGPYLLNRVVDFWIEKGITKIFVTFAEEEVELLLNYFKEYGFLLDGIFPYNYRKEKSEYYMSKLNLFDSLDKTQFKDLILKYLFHLRGYKILEDQEEYCIVQKYVYIKEAYRTLLFFNLNKNNTSTIILKKIKELMKDKNCSASIVVSYYPLDSFGVPNIKVIDSYDVESFFFPLNLKKEEFAGFISTVQKNYADRILYDGKQTLLDADKKSLRKEKVFYKYSNLPNAKRGQTFLFYESSPTSGIIGEGKVKEIVLDSPQNLYNRFNAKGILKLSEIEEYKNKKGQVMAISIGKFVKYKKKIPLKKIREIKKRFNPQGSWMLTEEELNKIRKEGKYPYPC
ncbi:GNAT family N-acetyltransferase [Candidatus Woesearchaeota archaeon]|nr:GNAT family N-acetyltransferase [Candidatus Woesearchaeota archaeon]